MKKSTLKFRRIFGTIFLAIALMVGFTAMIASVSFESLALLMAGDILCVASLASMCANMAYRETVLR